MTYDDAYKKALNYARGRNDAIRLTGVERVGGQTARRTRSSGVDAVAFAIAYATHSNDFEARRIAYRTNIEDAYHHFRASNGQTVLLEDMPGRTER